MFHGPRLPIAAPRAVNYEILDSVIDHGDQSHVEPVWTNDGTRTIQGNPIAESLAFLTTHVASMTIWIPRCRHPNPIVCVFIRDIQGNPFRTTLHPVSDQPRPRFWAAPPGRAESVDDVRSWAVDTAWWYGAQAITDTAIEARIFQLMAEGTQNHDVERSLGEDGRNMVRAIGAIPFCDDPQESRWYQLETAAQFMHNGAQRITFRPLALHIDAVPAYLAGIALEQDPTIQPSCCREVPPPDNLSDMLRATPNLDLGFIARAVDSDLLE